MPGRNVGIRALAALKESITQPVFLSPQIFSARMTESGYHFRSANPRDVVRTVQYSSISASEEEKANARLVRAYRQNNFTYLSLLALVSIPCPPSFLSPPSTNQHSIDATLISALGVLQGVRRRLGSGVARLIGVCVPAKLAALTVHLGVLSNGALGCGWDWQWGCIGPLAC